MNWTDERVELLKKLWSDGLSASQIAAQLGGVTRNAVIGKVHRLKLSGRGKTTSAASRAKKPAVEATSPIAAPSATTTTAPRTSKSASARTARPTSNVTAASSTRTASTPSVGATALEMEFVAEAVPHVDKRSVDNVVVPMSRHLTLLQLSENTCKWPIGDPLAEDFCFCGADSGDSGPYCAFHAKVAFQPVSERRRARA